MARINDSFLSGAGGKLGPLVIYTMNGRTFVRQQPNSYHDAKSILQLNQRQRFQVVNAFLRPFKRLVRITFAGEAKGRVAYNVAKSYNLKNACINFYPDVAINPEKALLSKGPLPLPNRVYCTPESNGVLIEWNNKPAWGNPKDTLLVISATTDFIYGDYSFTETTRSTGRYFYTLSHFNQKTEEIYIWIAFQNPEKNKMSNSLYISYTQKPTEQINPEESK